MSTQSTPEAFTAALDALASTDFDHLRTQTGYEGARRHAVATLRSLQRQLELPIELSRRIGWQEPAHVVALKMALDLGLLKELEKHGRNGGVTIATLAEKCDASPELVGRILRHLGAWEFIKETGVGEYAATSISNEMLDPIVSSGLDFFIDLTAPVTSRLPAYIRDGRYGEIGIPGKGNYETARESGQNFFEWLNDHPVALASFSHHMMGMETGRVSWMKSYPVEERMLQGANDNGPLLVDVGGGVGHHVKRFQKQYPQPPGRLFVQDLEKTLAQVPKDEVIEMQTHDFFTAQPVRGARAYFMHFIMHDWSDPECLKILGHLKDAMRPGYSKILIGDYVLASQNPEPWNTSLDISMMSLFGSRERTEEDWRALLKNAGLKMSGIFTLPGEAESVIEAVLE